MKRLTMLVVILLLALSLACGGSKPEDATPEATVEKTEATDAASSGDGGDAKTEEPEETQEAASDSGNSAGDADFHIDSGAFDELKSYRSELSVTFAPADGSEGKVLVLQEKSNDPPAQRVLMTMSGDFPGTEDMGGEEMDIEIIMIENNQWMRFGDMWMQTTSDAEDAIDLDDMAGLQDTFVDPENLNSLSEEEDLEYKGKEEINGIQTDHYFAEYDSLWGKIGIETDDIESGRADIWIAADPDMPQFIVRMEFEVTGKLELDDEGEKVDGTMTMDMEVTDVNKPVNIEAPEDTAGGMPEDIPAYPEAQDLTAVAGMIAFTTADDVETVTEFYNEALPDAGWDLEEESFIGTSWTKDDRTLTVMITEDEDSGGTSVLMMVDTGEE